MNPTTAKELVAAARSKIERERATKTDQVNWAAIQALEKERRRVAFVAEHGAILWRAMAWYGANNFVTEVLGWYQACGDLTPKRLDGLRSAVSFLEHGLTGRTLQ